MSAHHTSSPLKARPAERGEPGRPGETGGKVIVGMSGGVDSSVTALLLKQRGYEVEGLFMKNWNEDDGTEYCTAAADLMDAARVCKTLGIHLHTINFAEEYWDRVFAYFLDEYKAGRTPNPDILCNREIKFRAFLEHAQSLGANWIATGHYARLIAEPSGGKRYLHKGIDGNKDQSYFLHAVPQAALERTLMPLGKLEKPAVRELAEQHQLVTHDKKDSTGICFIGERRFKDFLENYLPASPGEIVDDTGRVLGEHRGLMFHTIGQRQGLGIGGRKDSSTEPWYVAGKQLESNRLLVVQGKDHPLLFRNTLEADQAIWFDDDAVYDGQTLAAKIRYRQADQPCTLRFLNGSKSQISLEFASSQRAVTPGQSAVLYDGERCLGGAVIV